MKKTVALSAMPKVMPVVFALALILAANRSNGQVGSPVAPAKNFQGTWEVGGQPRGPWVFNFRVDGAALTGRMWQAGGKIGPIEIIDGRVSGDTVSFRYVIPMQRPVNSSATFTLTGVLRKQQIEFRSALDTPNPTKTNPVTISSAQGELFGVSEKFTAKPSVAALAGRVTVEEGLPCPRFRIVFVDTSGKRFDPIKYEISVPMSPIHSTTNSVKAFPKPTLRTFLLRLPPGDYRPVISELPKGYALRAIRSDTIDITGGVLRVTENGAAPEVTVALSPAPDARWTKVQGRIVNAATRKVLPGGTQFGGRRNPASPEFVELTNDAVSEPWKSIIGPNGTFEFNRILPGTYQLRALPDSAATPSVRVVIPAAESYQLNVTVPDIAPVTCNAC